MTNSTGSKLTNSEWKIRTRINIIGKSVQKHPNNTTNNLWRWNCWLTTLQKGLYTVDMLCKRWFQEFFQWRKRRKRRWTKTVFTLCFLTFDVFSCSFLFAPPLLSAALPTTQSFMFQHMEKPKTWDVLHAKFQRCTWTTGPTRRGGAERSINCREVKWVCLPLSVSLFNLWSCFVLGRIRTGNMATPPIPVRRGRHMRTLKTILAECLFCSPWDASHSSFSLNLKILCHFPV